MSGDELSEAIAQDLAAWSLVAWFAKHQEVGGPSVEDVEARFTEEFKYVHPSTLLLPLVGHAGVLLRLLARERGQGLDEVIRSLSENGQLSYLDLALDDPDAQPDDEEE